LALRARKKISKCKFGADFLIWGALTSRVVGAWAWRGVEDEEDAVDVHPNDHEEQQARELANRLFDGEFDGEDVPFGRAADDEQGEGGGRDAKHSAIAILPGERGQVWAKQARQ
jgi:hypothetical protein